MELPVNTFKRALNAGKSPIGLWCTLSSHYAIEIVAGTGFDWLLLDTEHSPNELDMVLTQLQAAAAYPTHPVVRVPSNDMVTIKRVDTLDEAINLINANPYAHVALSIRRYRMKNRLLTLISIAAGLVTLSSSALAHHGTGISCDLTKNPVTAKAIVTEYKWSNPTSRSSSTSRMTKVWIWVRSSEKGSLNGRGPWHFRVI